MQRTTALQNFWRSFDPIDVRELVESTRRKNNRTSKVIEIGGFNYRTLNFSKLLELLYVIKAFIEYSLFTLFQEFLLLMKPF